MQLLVTIFTAYLFIIRSKNLMEEKKTYIHFLHFVIEIKSIYPFTNLELFLYFFREI